MNPNEQNCTPLEVGNATFPIAIKLPLYTLLMVIVITFTLSATFYQNSKQYAYSQRIQELQNQANLIQIFFQQFYDLAISDLQFLSNIEEIKNYDSNDHSSNNSEARISNIFSQKLISNPAYKQIRIINLNETGDELIKVISKSSGIQRIEHDNLQSKAHTNYFNAIKELTKNEIYISDIELNKEYKQVITPHEKVIRVAIPIFNDNENKHTALLINIDFNYLRNSLKTIEGDTISLFLSNERGDYLIHPDETKTFGFDLGSRHLLQNDLSKIDLFDQNNVTNRGFNNLKFNDEPFISYIHLLTNTKFKHSPNLILLLQDKHINIQTQLDTLTDKSIYIGLIFSVISIFITLLISRNLSAPLSLMTQAIKNYKEGEEIKNLPIHSKDEIGVLARSFSNLLAKVTASREMQNQAIAKSNEATKKYQSILNNAQDAIITIDQSGKIQSTNQSFRHLFGYTDEEIINQYFSILMPDSFKSQQQDMIENLLNTDTPSLNNSNQELKSVNKSGQIFDISITVWEVDLSSEKILTGLIQDITEKKQTAKNIAYTLSTLEATLESSTNGIMVFNRDGKTVHSNKNFAKIWKLPDNLLEKGNEKERLTFILNQLVKPGKFLESIEALEHNPSDIFQDILECKDGRLIELYSQPMVVMVEIAGRVWSFSDITLKRKAELEIIKAKEVAENAARHKSEFLASMSHEIRTPMNGILGMLQLLIKSPLDQQQNHHATLAQSSAISLLSIINDILDFSKIEAGKMNIENIDFNLTDQLSHSCESLAHKAQEKGLSLILDVSKIDITTVKGDPNRIGQILTNIIGNAIKFTEKGQILVKAELKSLNEKNETILECHVIDSGIGISKNKINSLFESFTQVDASTTREYGGTGLGLSIVKQLCELMHGYIDVKSIENQGSDFLFSIKLEQSINTKALLPPISIANKNIVILESNVHCIAMINAQLSKWDANIIEISTPKALDQFILHNQLNIDIFLVDSKYLTSKKQLKAIRQSQYSSNAKFILITPLHHKYNNDIKNFDFHLTKPININQIFSAFSQFYQSHEKPINTFNQSLEPDNIKPSIFKTKRVLLVEDNFVNQAVASAILDEIELKHDIAENGLIALETLNNADSAHYDLILMDCQMPKLDGYQTTIKIRNNEAGNKYNTIPIIAMTANAMKGDKEKCIHCGMNDYISKPIDQALLISALDNWLSK